MKNLTLRILVLWTICLASLAAYGQGITRNLITTNSDPTARSILTNVAQTVVATAPLPAANLSGTVPPARLPSVTNYPVANWYDAGLLPASGGHTNVYLHVDANGNWEFLFVAPLSPTWDQLGSGVNNSMLAVIDTGGGIVVSNGGVNIASFANSANASSIIGGGTGGQLPLNSVVSNAVPADGDVVTVTGNKLKSTKTLNNLVLGGVVSGGYSNLFGTNLVLASPIMITNVGLATNLSLSAGLSGGRPTLALLNADSMLTASHGSFGDITATGTGFSGPGSSITSLNGANLQAGSVNSNALAAGLIDTNKVSAAFFNWLVSIGYGVAMNGGTGTNLWLTNTTLAGTTTYDTNIVGTMVVSNLFGPTTYQTNQSGQGITNTFLVAGANVTLTTNYPSGGVQAVTVASTGGGSQTPWTGDINAAQYSLTNAKSISVTGTGTNWLGATYLTNGVYGNGSGLTGVVASVSNWPINGKNDFGLLGNGSDESAGLQSAISAAASQNRALYLPAGTYGASTQLVANGYVEIYGDGAFKTTLQFKHLGWLQVCNSNAAAPVYWCNIHDIGFDGAGEAAVAPQPLRFGENVGANNYADPVFLSRLFINNFTNGLFFYSAGDVHMSDLQITHCTNSIYLPPPAPLSSVVYLNDIHAFRVMMGQGGIGLNMNYFGRYYFNECMVQYMSGPGILFDSRYTNWSGHLPQQFYWENGHIEHCNYSTNGEHAYNLRGQVEFLVGATNLPPQDVVFRQNYCSSALETNVVSLLLDKGNYKLNDNLFINAHNSQIYLSNSVDLNLKGSTVGSLPNNYTEENDFTPNGLFRGTDATYSHIVPFNLSALPTIHWTYLGSTNSNGVNATNILSYWHNGGAGQLVQFANENNILNAQWAGAATNLVSGATTTNTQTYFATNNATSFSPAVDFSKSGGQFASSTNFTFSVSNVPWDREAYWHGRLTNSGANASTILVTLNGFCAITNGGAPTSTFYVTNLTSKNQVTDLMVYFGYNRTNAVVTHFYDK